jgi:GTP-binding protein
MIPCDSDDIEKEYHILLHELEAYNPELMHKPRLLAISKSDMLDDVMRDQMAELLPQGVESIFISSVANYNIDELKDKLWTLLNQPTIGEEE